MTGMYTKICKSINKSVVYYHVAGMIFTINKQKSEVGINIRFNR